MSEVVPVAHTPAGDEPHEEEARMSAKMTVVPFTEVRLPIEKSVSTFFSKNNNNAATICPVQTHPQV